MADDQIRAGGIKQARRELVRVLNVMYGIGPFGFDAICAGLTHLLLPNKECVQRDLTYLCDKAKGYVKWTNEPLGADGKPKPGAMMPWEDRLFSLTAKGNEVANKISSDPALEP